jgi:type IV secretion system protein TrbF
VRRNWFDSYDFISTPGSQALNDYARANDPFAKLGYQQIAIDLSSVIRASLCSFRAEWVEHRCQDGALADNSRWTAILTVAIQPPTSAGVLRKNPLGIYVTAINWSKQLGQ